MASRLSRRDESLAFQSAVLTAARILAFAFTFAIPIVLTEAFAVGVDDVGARARFGLYKLAFLIAITGSRLLNVGLTASLYYFVPRDKGEGQPYIVQALLALGAIGVLAAAGMTAFREPIAAALSSPDLVELLPILALMVLLMLPGEVVPALPVIDRRPLLGAGIVAGSNFVRAAALIGAAVLFNSVEAVVWAGTLAAGTNVIALVIYVYFRGQGEPSKPQAQLIRDQFRYALPYAVVVVFEVALASFHQFYVKGHTTDAIFGIYAAGVFQVPVIDLLVMSVAEVVLVRAAAAWERNDVAEMRRVWHGGIARLATLVVPVWIISEVLAADVVGFVFGPTFIEAAFIFRIFLVALLLYLIIDHAILRATGDTKFLSQATAAGFIASVVALLLISPHDLMLGGVLSFVVGIAVMRFSGLFLVARRLDIPLMHAFPWKAFLSANAVGLAAAIPAALAMWGASEFLLHDIEGRWYHFYRLLIGGPLFLAAYGTLAWTFHILEREEITRIVGRFIPSRGNQAD